MLELPQTALKLAWMLSMLLVALTVLMVQSPTYPVYVCSFQFHCDNIFSAISTTSILCSAFHISLILYSVCYIRTTTVVWLLIVWWYMTGFSFTRGLLSFTHRPTRFFISSTQTAIHSTDWSGCQAGTTQHQILPLLGSKAWLHCCEKIVFVVSGAYNICASSSTPGCVHKYK